MAFIFGIIVFISQILEPIIQVGATDYINDSSNEQKFCPQKTPEYVPTNTTTKQSIASCIYIIHVQQRIIGLTYVF